MPAQSPESHWKQTSNGVSGKSGEYFSVNVPGFYEIKSSSCPTFNNSKNYATFVAYQCYWFSFRDFAPDNGGYGSTEELTYLEVELESGYETYDITMYSCKNGNFHDYTHSFTNCNYNSDLSTNNCEAGISFTIEEGKTEGTIVFTQANSLKEITYKWKLI